MPVHVLRRIISFPLLASSYRSKTVKQYFLLITVGLWLCLAMGGSCYLHHNMLSTTDHLRRGLVTINHAARVITTLIFICPRWVSRHGRHLLSASKRMWSTPFLLEEVHIDVCIMSPIKPGKQLTTNGPFDSLSHYLASPITNT